MVGLLRFLQKVVSVALLTLGQQDGQLGLGTAAGRARGLEGSARRVEATS